MGFKELDPTGPSPLWLAAGINVFAFGIARFTGSSLSAAEPGGILTLGGLNTSLFTSIVNYIPVSKKEYWQIPLDFVEINGKIIQGSQKNEAAIDTGTNLIGAPSVVAKSIYEEIPGSKAGVESYQGLRGILLYISLKFYYS